MKLLKLNTASGSYLRTRLLSRTAYPRNFSCAALASSCNGLVPQKKRDVLIGRCEVYGLNQNRTIVTWLPEAMQGFSIWGASGYALKTLHADGVLPYWACFATINVLVRAGLFPLVIYGAQTSSRFAKVIPEVQFLLSLFQADLKKLRERKGSLVERFVLMRTNMATLGGIYKLHNINPFSVFLSPLLQIPIFMYLSVDLRKIVNGLDPELAQALVESSIAWVPDLTEPDPYFGLPILAGLLMYANVEVAIGRRSLTGEASAKSDTGLLLKDVFQSLAVFMPCFTSQLPGGVQIYLATSFLVTMAQSAALRTEGFRQLVGLPSMLAPPPDAKYANEFIQLKQLEQKAREMRGDGPVLGKGVLALDLEVSFAGTYRKSTIKGSGITTNMLLPKVSTLDSQTPTMKVDDTSVVPPEGPFVNGVSAPIWQLREQQQQERLEKELQKRSSSSDVATKETNSRDYMPQFSDEVMEKANRGEFPVETRFVKEKAATSSSRSKLSLKRFKRRKPGR